MDEDEARQRVKALGLQMESFLTVAKRLRRDLPEISEPALALQQAPSVLEALALAVDLVMDELPPMAKALTKAAASTQEALDSEHRETAKALEGLV